MRANLYVALPTIIGYSLKKIRNERGENQKYVADLLGITVSGLSKIENGATALSVEQLFLFSEIYGTSASEIICSVQTIVSKLNSAGIIVINSKSNATRPKLGSHLKSDWWLAFIE